MYYFPLVVFNTRFLDFTIVLEAFQLPFPPAFTNHLFLTTILFRRRLDDVMPMHFLSHAQQLAAHLRSEILHGKWSGSMPGILRLEVELGVNRNTIDAALKLLEQEGVLKGQGAGRKRRIVLPENHASSALRVAILDYEQRQESADYLNELYLLLSEAGHTPFFTPKCLTALGMNVKRIARMVNQTQADAWVVCSGSQEVLTWFAEQEAHAFALFGRHTSVPIAGVRPDKTLAFAQATRRLISLDHRRISLLCHRQLRLPQPGRVAQAFLAEFETVGIKAGDFNLPDWEPTSEGFTAHLDSLFRYTPPSALILDEPHLYCAALHFLAERGLRVPQDVSLICTDANSSFIWSKPSVAHIRWDYRPVIHRIVRWTNNVSRGKEDKRQTLTKAEFIEGGTMGPAASR